MRPKIRPDSLSSRDPLYENMREEKSKTQSPKTVKENLRRFVASRYNLKDDQLFISFNELASAVMFDERLEGDLKSQTATLLHKIPGVTITEAGLLIKKQEFLGRHLHEVVEEFLDSRPTEYFSTKQIAQELGKNETSIRAALMTLYVKDTSIEEKRGARIFYKSTKKDPN